MIRFFRPGDRVQLKSGGPVMEVMRYASEDNKLSSTQVECVWYDPDEGRKCKIFHQNSLCRLNWYSRGPKANRKKGMEDKFSSVPGNFQLNKAAFKDQ